MKILAIDYGSKNIGLAMSDDEGRMAFAYKTLRVKTQDFSSWQKIISDLKKICQQEKVKKIIIGMPLWLTGDKSQTTEVVFEFAHQLEKGIGLKVETIDERWSTIEAYKNKISRDRSRPVLKHSLDALSAQILLQSWLEKNKRK